MRNVRSVVAWPGSLLPYGYRLWSLARDQETSLINNYLPYPWTRLASQAYLSDFRGKPREAD